MREIHGSSRPHKIHPTSRLTGCSSARDHGRIEDLRARASAVGRARPSARLSTRCGCAARVWSRSSEAERSRQNLSSQAGFDAPSRACSMCLAMNDDRLKPGERCALASNRNFEGRQAQRAAPIGLGAMAAGGSDCRPLRRYPRVEMIFLQFA